jgi:hypothetical protein
VRMLLKLLYAPKGKEIRGGWRKTTRRRTPQSVTFTKCYYGNPTADNKTTNANSVHRRDETGMQNVIRKPERLHAGFQHLCPTMSAYLYEINIISNDISFLQSFMQAD